MLDGLMRWMNRLAGQLFVWAVDLALQFAAWLLGLLTGGVSWLIRGIVLPDPPPWLLDGVAAVEMVMGWAGQLGHWIPWPIAVTVGLSVLGCLIAGLLIQAVRIIASFLSAGGGAT